MRESLIYFNQLIKKFEPYIEALLKDPSFKEELYKLGLAIQKSNQAFGETGSFAFCKACAESGIICCGKDLEWKLSKEELFINMCLFQLKGKDFKVNTSAEEACLFLGKKGCILELTPLFCRNFFCSKLSLYLGYEKLIYIQSTLEEEAILSFRLCEYVKEKLKKR